MSIRTKIDFSGITSDHIVTSDNKKYIREDDEIFNSLKDEIAACENAQVQTELATLQILDIKEQTKVIANNAIDSATERAETAAQNAETAAINALEAERNVTEFSESFAKLDEDNTFTGNNNFTGNLTIDDSNVITESIANNIYLKVDGSNYITGRIGIDPSKDSFTIGYLHADNAGSLLTFRGINYPNTPGAFEIWARDGSTDKILKGKTDGTLSWDGKNILTDDIAVGFIGEIKFSSYDSVPSGYLICDGSKISRTTYSALFKVIGTKWGAGNGSTTFALPNLIDKVAWGAKTAGAYKNAGLPNITGKTGIFENYQANKLSSSGALFYSQYPDKLSVGAGGSGWYYYVNIDASKSNAIYGKSSTVQPPAATVVPIIRYI